MFTNDITLAGDASSTQTYSLTGVSGGRSARQDAVRGTALPRTMTISHQTVKRGERTADRHLVRLDLVVEDSTTKEQAALSCQLVIEQPRVVATQAQMQDMCTQMRNFFIAGNITKLLNSEP